MSERIKQILGQVEWNSLLLIFIFGSAGGLTYWFYMLYEAYLSNAAPDPDFILRWLIILPAVLMLGGFTALVGVFYITGNKPDEIPKAVVIAMVFGFSFNSVLQYLNESQSKALNLEQAENSTADLTRENARLKAELRERELPANTDRRSEELLNIRTAQADQVIGALKESTTRSAREKFVNYSKELILDMQESALALRKAPAVAQALRSLGEVGARSVQVSDEVCFQAIESINIVGLDQTSGAQTKTEALQVYYSADESLHEIARVASEEGSTVVTERAMEIRVQLAARTVRQWHNRFTPEQKSGVREHLLELQASIRAERLRIQMDAILQELAGGVSEP